MIHEGLHRADLFAPATGWAAPEPEPRVCPDEAGSGGAGGLFSCIVADPPWEYPEGFAGGPGHGDWTPTPLPYPSMSVAEICALRVAELAAQDCRLWLWTTNKYLPDAFGVMAAWGFKYRQLIVWHKLDSNLGGSVAPNSAEFLLVGVKGHPPIKRKWKTSVVGLAHGKRHSQKPREWHYLIEQVDEGPRLEMFARRPMLGWSVWGNQVACDSELVRSGGGGGVEVGDSTATPRNGAVQPIDAGQRLAP